MINPFKNLTEENQKKLFTIMESDIYTFKKGASIFSSLKLEKSIGIVLDGSIIVVQNDEQGNQRRIEELHKDDVFGSNITIIDYLESDMIVKEDCRILLIDYRDLIEHTKSNDEVFVQFLKNMLEITLLKVDEKNQRIKILSQRTIRNKLLAYFEVTAKKFGNITYELPYSITFLADYLSIDRCAMSREIKQLKDERQIEIKNKKITVRFLNNKAHKKY